MEYTQWEALGKEMAIKAIVSDLNGIFVPTVEAMPRAEQALASRDQRALEVEYRMGQALIALEELGYDIVKRP